MIGTAIAIRYSAQRPQFGDKLIMDYLSHQRRLLPGLAATYALHLGLKQLKVRCFGGRFCCPSYKDSHTRGSWSAPDIVEHLQHTQLHTTYVPIIKQDEENRILWHVSEQHANLPQRIL